MQGGTRLDKSFSDSKKFRFMNVLWSFIDTTKDKQTIAKADSVDMGPRGKYSTDGMSAIIAGSTNFATLRPPPKRFEIEGMNVIVFEQTYGSKTNAPLVFGPVQGLPPSFPPIWTTLRIAMSADGTKKYEIADFSYFPHHFFFIDGEYVKETVENVYHGWIQPGEVLASPMNLRY
jgi:hypothetical protein